MFTFVSLARLWEICVRVPLITTHPWAVSSSLSLKSKTFFFFFCLCFLHRITHVFKKTLIFLYLSKGCWPWAAERKLIYDTMSSRVKARREWLNLVQVEVTGQVRHGLSKVSSVSNRRPKAASHSDRHRWGWWKGWGSHVAGDKTIRGRCGVYSGDCRQEVAPWQDTRERRQRCSTDWFCREWATVGAALISLSCHHNIGIC